MSDPRPSDGALAALRELAMPVAVIGAAVGERRGCSTGTVAYLSLQPVLLATSLGRKSRTHALVEESGYFSVSLLAADQVVLAEKAAQRSDAADKLAALGIAALTWEGVPAVAGALAVLFCAVSDVVAAGDHDCFVGAVRHVVVHDDGRSALVRWRRSYVATTDADDAHAGAYPL